jgi:isoleucyl-tRNA synthetase
MPESIHLHEMPLADAKLINPELENEMEIAKSVSQTVLSLREENKLRLRWPLREVVVQTKTGKELKLLKNVLAGMCNVSSVKESTDAPKGNYSKKEIAEGLVAYLNVDVDAHMKEEWELRELARRIQDARKTAKLHPNEVVKLKLDCSDSAFLKKYSSQIEKETNTKIESAKGKMEKLLEREFFVQI